MAVTITGDKKLNRAIARLGKKSSAIMAAGLRAGLGEVSKSIKDQFPTRVRRGIGHRFKKKGRRHIVAAKAGAGVGKRNKLPERRGRGGVGIARENIHWYIVGTGPRQTRRGYGRGRMPAVGLGLVRRGVLTAKSRYLAVMTRKMWQRVEKEAAKARR